MLNKLEKAFEESGTRGEASVTLNVNELSRLISLVKANEMFIVSNDAPVENCSDCGGQGIDPRDKGDGTFICEVCEGTGE